jgi:hypothetical protein
MFRSTWLPKGDKVETLFWQSKEEHSVRLRKRLAFQISCFSSAQIEEEQRLKMPFWHGPSALSFHPI